MSSLYFSQVACYNLSCFLLQKMIQLVVLGKSYNWQKANIGVSLASEVFVNMMQAKRYEHKIKELSATIRGKITALKSKVRYIFIIFVIHVNFLVMNNTFFNLRCLLLHQQRQKKYPKCFVSYCWSNSADAVRKGSRQQAGSLGWGDPREIKKTIEDNGMSCWMDVERVGQVSIVVNVVV